MHHPGSSESGDGTTAVRQRWKPVSFTFSPVHVLMNALSILNLFLPSKEGTDLRPPPRLFCEPYPVSVTMLEEVS